MGMEVLTVEAFEDLCDLAGHGIGYWVERGHVEPDCYTLVEREDGVVIRLTKERVEKVLTDIRGGKHRDELGEGQWEALSSWDVAEMDVDDADVLIQLSAFGEVVYG